MAKEPVITIYLPDNLVHWAYMGIVYDTIVDGDATVRFRFGDADHWVYKGGKSGPFTLDMRGAE